MPTKEMFRFKVVDKSLFLFGVLKSTVFCLLLFSDHFKTCMVLPTLKKAFGNKERMGDKMENKHSQDNNVNNIVTAEGSK